jgi:hypothetical protein
MNDPLDYSNVGSEYVLDVQEDAVKLTNEQLEEIQQRITSYEEEQQQLQQQETQPPTGGQTTPTIEQPTPTGEVATEQQQPTELVGSPDTPYRTPEGNIDYERLEREGRELDLKEVQGLIDFPTDFANKLLSKTGLQIPKASKYENDIAQTVRSITSVIAPTLFLQGAGLALASKAQAASTSLLGAGNVINRLGNTAFMKFLGTRGIEGGAGVLVDAISSETEGENLSGSIKKSGLYKDLTSKLPAQFDFIPDSFATLDKDSSDEKRIKNINEGLALGFLLPFVGSLGKLKRSLGQIGKGVIKEPKLIGETPKAQKIIDSMQPAAKSDDLVEELSRYAAKQEADLDELGYYNQAMNPNANVPLKGVNDVYDWNEVGMRSLDDFGIIGASVDAVRIAKNKGSVYGRLGNFISEPARKFAISTPGGVEQVTVGLAKQLKDADRYRVDAADWAISFDEIQEQGDNLVLELFDPTVGVDEIRKILDPVIVKNQFGLEELTDEGYRGIFRMIDEQAEAFTGMDIAKAQAYSATSIAGQIADLSEGIRLNRGSVAVDQAKQQVRDNLAYLQQLKRTTEYYVDKKRGIMALGERVRALGKTPAQLNKEIIEQSPQALRIIQDESDRFTQNWQYLEENNPEVLDSFLELYELSDGKINSITKVNEDILNTFVRWRPIVDGNPEAPNILAQAVRGNFYNSLFAVTSSAKAFYGNVSGMVGEPLAYFTGALMRQDLKSVQRGWMAYSAILDTQKKALPYAGKLFMKASQNPNSVKDVTRLDFVIKNEEKINVYKKLAQVESDNGRDGFKYVVDLYDNLKALEADPVFRFIPNTFTGFDGYTSATVANAQARFRAMDEIQRLGKEASPVEVKRLANKEYNSMFDENGIIVDEAVKYNTGELALNLDNPIIKSLNNLYERVPILRMFNRFPGILVNVIRTGDEYIPAPIRSFQKDINELAYTPVKTFMAQPELVDNILSARGYKVNQMDGVAKLNTLVDLKNKTLGRKGISSIITGLVLSNVATDLLTGDGWFEMTGDGSYDRGLMAARKRRGWKPRTVTIFGKKISYDELLGPGLSNWVATLATVGDNFDMLGEAATENLKAKMAIILAAAVTEDAALSILTPLVEMLSGNETAMDRFAAGQINSLAPLGGIRNNVSQILDGGLKDVQKDIMGYLKNKNQYLNFFDLSNRQPYIYSPITGKVPNNYNMMVRMYNTLSPIKIYEGESPEEKFLNDIEYDSSSLFKTREGVEILPKERSKLSELMGERGYWRSEISRISKLAAARSTVKELKEARSKGVRSEDTPIGQYDLIHMELDKARKNAEKLAFNDLDLGMKGEIQKRIVEKKSKENQAMRGIIPELKNLTTNIRY